MTDKPFRLDRTVTLSLVFALIIQSASALVWAGAVDARLAAVEIRANILPQLNIRLTRLEEQMLAQGRSLDRIETRLEDAPRHQAELHE